MAVAVVLTTSRKVADEVEKKVKSEGDFSNFAVFVVEDLAEAFEISNEFAPEHLTVAVKNPEEWLGKVRNAGSVFLGNFSPVAAGDYASGTNHVLPTAGYAKIYGGLSVESFLKHFTFQMLSEESMRRIGGDVVKIAEAEGLRWHAESVRKRLEKI